MILVDELKLCFVQIPHTASTTFGNDLIDNYGGRQVLSKHSYLHELKAKIPEVYNTYCVVGCVRNPLDDRLSAYAKLKTNHMGLYEGGLVDPRANKGGWLSRTRRKKILQQNFGFDEFIRETSRYPFVSPISIHQTRYDKIFRFETITSEYSALMAELTGRSIVVPEKGNQTAERSSNFLENYTPLMLSAAEPALKPFMLEFDFRLPSAWNDSLTTGELQRYKIAKFLKKQWWAFRAR